MKKTKETKGARKQRQYQRSKEVGKTPAQIIKADNQAYTGYIERVRELRGLTGKIEWPFQEGHKRKRTSKNPRTESGPGIPVISARGWLEALRESRGE